VEGDRWEVGDAAGRSALWLSYAYSRGVSVRRLRLIGTQEIPVRLGGVSRQRVYQLTRRADFPQPIAELAQGSVWLAEDVDRWIASRRTRVSQPRRADQQ
jgi:prophage regulatory protein